MDEQDWQANYRRVAAHLQHCVEEKRRLTAERDGWQQRCEGEIKIQVRYRDSVDQWVRAYEELQGRLNQSQAALDRVRAALAEYRLMPADVCIGINEPADKVRWLLRRLAIFEK